MGGGCIIGPKVRIQGPAVLGTSCVIGEGSLIDQSVLWHQVRVGAGARLIRTIVAANCSIGDGSELGVGCVLGEDVQLEAGSRLKPGTRL